MPRFHSLFLLFGLLVIVFLPLSTPSWAGTWQEPPFSETPYDVYLTGDRICRQCVWRHAGPRQVEFQNQAGFRGVYPANEIIGVDKHPMSRRILRHSIHGVGYPGQILAPQAFDEEEHPLRYYWK